MSDADLLKEALDLLEVRELNYVYDEDACRSCDGYLREGVEVVNGVARKGYVFHHADDCAWLLLMKKAGRR